MVRKSSKYSILDVENCLSHMDNNCQFAFDYLSIVIECIELYGMVREAKGRVLKSFGTSDKLLSTGCTQDVCM